MGNRELVVRARTSKCAYGLANKNRKKKGRTARGRGRTRQKKDRFRNGHDMKKTWCKQEGEGRGRETPLIIRSRRDARDRTPRKKRDPLH